MTHLSVRRAVSVGVLSLSLAAAVAVPARAGAPQAGLTPAAAVPAVAPAASPVTSWVKLTSGGLSSIDQVSLLRRGGVLHAAWHRQDSSSSESVRVARISASGSKLGINTAVSGWASLVHDPALANTQVKPLVIFGGIRTTSSAEIFGGQMAASSWNGTGWTFEDNSFGQSRYAYGSYGTAAVEHDSDQVNAFALNNVIYVHLGSDPEHPAANPDYAIAETSGTSIYDTALVSDTSTGTPVLWAAWFDLNSGTAVENGIRYLRDPISSSTIGGIDASHEGTDTQDPGQRVALAAVKTGPWVAYRHGYPAVDSVRLYNLITHRSITVPKSKDAKHVSLAAAPGGRLWVLWTSGSTGSVRAVRTNGAVTRFEPVVSLKNPGTVWTTAAEGTRGPLDLVVNATNSKNVYSLYYRRVSARMSVKVVVSRAKGRAVLTVTDAGLALKGAKVTYKGHTKTTNAAGKVTISIGKAKGKRTFTVKRSGYATAKKTVTVK